MPGGRAQPLLRLSANAGRIGAYQVCIVNDDSSARHGARPAVTHAVPSYGTSLGEVSQRPGFRVGWARMPGGEAILFFNCLAASLTLASRPPPPATLRLPATPYRERSLRRASNSPPAHDHFAAEPLGSLDQNQVIG